MPGEKEVVQFGKCSLDDLDKRIQELVPVGDTYLTRSAGLLRRSHDLLIHHTKGQQCHCGYQGKCEVCLARELISELHQALEAK